MFTPTIVTGGRQTGKTTMVLQYIRDYLNGNTSLEPGRKVVVVFKSSAPANHFRNRAPDLAEYVDIVLMHRYPELGSLEQVSDKGSFSLTVFFDATPDDDLIRTIHKYRETENPCVVEFAIDHPGLKIIGCA